MLTLDERYKTDPQFHKLTDTFYNFFKKCEFTPSEVREAAMLAQMLYENHHPRSAYFSPELQNIINAHMSPNSINYFEDKNI